METIKFSILDVLFTILVASDAVEAIEALDAGFCPVECAFGEVSVVDELMLDHHGDLSHLPPACRQGEKAAGARRDDARFVVTGAADADAVMAICMVAGLLDPALIQPILSTIAARDVSPHVDMAAACRKDKQVTALLWWQQQRWGGCWESAIRGMVTAVTTVLADEDAYQDVLVREEARRALAEKVMAEGMEVGEVLVVSVPAELGFGFDVWYQEYPFVVAHLEKWGSITVGATSEVAAQRYGANGLLDFFNDQEGAWGGRSTVGGSPRGQQMSFAEAIAVAADLDEGVRPCQCGSMASWHSCASNQPTCG